MMPRVQPPPAFPGIGPMSTWPVYEIHPPDGYVIENVDAVCNPPGSVEVGVGANGSTNIVIRNNRLNGFIKPVNLSGGSRGAYVHHNVIVNATPDPGTWSPTGSGDAHGIYMEGCDGVEIAFNIILDTGWWPTADFNTQDALSSLSRRHGIYCNEANGSTDAKWVHDNIILNCCGSQIGCRLGGDVYGNILMSGFDWDIVMGGLGNLPKNSPYGTAVRIYGNLTFGPVENVVPYYGGGSKLDSDVQRSGCRWSNCGNTGMSNATITNNALAVDPWGKVIHQNGFWYKGGAVVAPAGKHLPTLADYYGRPDFYQSMHCDDAPLIAAWLAEEMARTPSTIIGFGEMHTGERFNMITA